MIDSEWFNIDSLEEGNMGRLNNYLVKPSNEEIDAILNAAAAAEDAGSRVPGQSYESGVKAALEWVIGNHAEPPLDLVDYADLLDEDDA